uniref:Golgi apparatus membrane protein TVP38 n=1 Tax=Psilocybe cubensis TaxID=181762 RepID=A0A8H7XRT8_PSICU
MAVYNTPMNNAPGHYLTTNYPPQRDAMYDTVTLVSSVETKVPADSRQISRTPSPTPSEAKALQTGFLDWKTMRQPKYWFRREWLWYYILLAVTLVLVGLMTIYHKQIVDWLTPVTQWLFKLKFGWLVPIGVLFVISFPPLFGHEIVAVLCGLVWGLWVGFGIVAAGTFLGEVGNFYAFRYCCRARGEKLERTSIFYACLARVVRDGGFKIALIARLSAIPGHFTTGIFSACGMGIIIFSIAAILSLPKQFITVYLGVILKQSNDGTEDTKSKIISDTVLGITVVITFVAMWYIFLQMNKVTPQVIYERRKARQAKLSRATGSPYMHAGPSMTNPDVFNPTGSESDIPLTSTHHDAAHQQWDRHGKAIGYAPDPNLYTPQARTPTRPVFTSNYPRDEEEAAGHRPLREESTDDVEWDIPQRGTTSPRLNAVVSPTSLHNPYSPNHRRDFENEIVQTPTQASFVNEGAGPSTVRMVQSSSNKPHGSFDVEDPYGGYEVPHRHGHAHELTASSFRTAYSSSPDAMDDAPIPNPHAASSHPYPGPIYPSPRPQSPKPPSYVTTLR